MAKKLLPSADCIVKNELGKQQTGYVPFENLLAFLKAKFGAGKQFGIEVQSLNHWKQFRKLIHPFGLQHLNERWTFYAPRLVTYVSAELWRALPKPMLRYYLSQANYY